MPSLLSKVDELGVAIMTKRKLAHLSRNSSTTFFSTQQSDSSRQDTLQSLAEQVARNI